MKEVTMKIDIKCKKQKPTKHPYLRTFIMGVTFSLTPFYTYAQIAGQINTSITQFQCDSSYHSFREKIADAIAQDIKDKVTGYALSISYKSAPNSVERSGGNARLPQDMPPDMFVYPMSTSVKYVIASLHKTIVAAAVVKLLNQKGLSLDTRIGPFLPRDWKIGPPQNGYFMKGVDDITFRQLLNHTSGIVDGQNGWGGAKFQTMRKMVENGIFIYQTGTSSYSNAGYDLLRITVPFLSGLQQQPPAGNYDLNNYALANVNAFDQFVQTNLFQPAGLPTILARPMDPDYDGLTYPVPPFSEGLNGKLWESNWVDFALYHMSVKEMHRFYKALNFSSTILPAALAKQMREEKLGYDIRANDSFGNVVSAKNGGWGIRNNYGLVVAGGWQEFIFNDELQITVVTNSENKTVYQTIRDAILESNIPTSLATTHVSNSSFVVNWKSAPYREDTDLTHYDSSAWINGYNITIWDALNAYNKVTVTVPPYARYSGDSPAACNQRSVLIDKSIAPFLTPGKKYLYTIRGINVQYEKQWQRSKSGEVILPL